MTPAAIAVVLAIAAPPSGESSGKAPVRVDADEVHYAFQKGEVTFTGNPVTLTRDDAKLTCRRLVAHTDAAGRISRAACAGDVRFARGAKVVTCETATFEDAEDRVVCEGSPTLSDGGTQAQGTRLVYDLRSDEARLKDAKVTVPGEQVDARRKALESRRAGAKK